MKNVNIKKSKARQVPKSLTKGSQTHKVFSTLISLMKKTGQEVKDYLDFCLWFDPVALMKGPYYYSELEDKAPTSKQMTESAIKQAIKRLELSDYIKVKWDRQDKQKQRISLTEKGVLEFIRCNIDQRKQDKQKWDGKWRIVVFDVLENRRQIRDLLRNRLKWLGFKELQRSVWIFPYDVRKEIEQILNVCHIDIIGDVRFLTVEEMNDDEDLRKDFGLSQA